MKKTPAPKLERSEPKPTPSVINLKKSRADLIEIHRQGKALLGEFSERGQYQQQSRIKRANELGINPAELNKRIAFANKYDKASLQELLALTTPQNKPLSWGHVRKLLTVHVASQRCRFAVLAADNGWSVQMLSREIDSRRKLPKRGGRPPRQRPLNPVTLREIEGVTNQVWRLLDSLQTRPDAATLATPPKRELAKCQKLLPNVLTSLRQLQQKLNSFTEQLGNAMTGAL